MKIDEHIYVHEMAAESRRWVGRRRLCGPGLAGNCTGAGYRGRPALLVAPAQVRLPAVDRERLSYVEIRDRRDRELVTVIELLSPGEQVHGSRSRAIPGETHGASERAGASRRDRSPGGGPPLPAADRPDCSYSVLVSRAQTRPNAEFWPIALRECLPVIPIPVRDPDSDARLDLQALLDQIYDDAGYA